MVFVTYFIKKINATALVMTAMTLMHKTIMMSTLFWDGAGED